jgi:GDP-D-mannose dehydratase
VQSEKSVVMKSVVAEFLLAKGYDVHGVIRRASNFWP